MNTANICNHIKVKITFVYKFNLGPDADLNHTSCIFVTMVTIFVSYIKLGHNCAHSWKCYILPSM